MGTNTKLSTESMAQAPAVYTCAIDEINALNQTTYEVVLRSCAGRPFHYHAGQYLKLKLELQDHAEPLEIPYSIANSADSQQAATLQLLIHVGGELASAVMRHLIPRHQANECVEVMLPVGHAFLQSNLELPHLLIAAGSGIAKIKALTEAISLRNPSATVSVYWSNQQPGDFYWLDKFSHWANQYEQRRFTPVLESAHTDWPGSCGYLYEVIARDAANLKNAQTYLCGSPQMVYGTIDQLRPLGLQTHNCYSDVFEYAPRTTTNYMLHKKEA